MKSAKALFWMGVLSVMSMAPIFLSLYDVKVDVFLFYDRDRYLENIGYDVLQMMTTIILTRMIWLLIPERKYKRYAFDFLVVAWLALPAYFLFYSQYVNIVFVPLLAILLYISYIKNTKK